jgi:hypothetical protein
MRAGAMRSKGRTGYALESAAGRLDTLAARLVRC